MIGLRSRRVVTPEGERAAIVWVEGETIAAVEPHEPRSSAARLIDLGDYVLLPGLVDTHVHCNEPGRTAWEGFATATSAAAAGGVTTILDMPLNSIPATVSVDALESKRRAARGQLQVDVGFWAGAIPGNASQLQPLHEAGVFGFKCFRVDSGVAEFPPLDRAGLEGVLAVLAPLGAQLIEHAELPELIGASHGRRYVDYLHSRPAAAEEAAIAELVELAGRLGARAHVVHLSSAGALDLVRQAKADGLALTVETCPHYLCLTAEEVPDGSSEFKCAPPIRDNANREALWNALAEGTIDCVVSDHSPCPPELKRLDSGDFGAAWGGIASLQLGLSVVWTEAERRGHTLAELAAWMAAGPAKVAGLTRKGMIAPGYDADLAIVDPDATFVVDPARLHHRHPLTPYAGRRLKGVVRATWLRGAPVQGEPRGRLLRRGET